MMVMTMTGRGVQSSKLLALLPYPTMALRRDSRENAKKSVLFFRVDLLVVKVPEGHLSTGPHSGYAVLD
jgi:hypothetical protein